MRILESENCETHFPHFEQVICAVPEEESFNLCNIDNGTPLTCGVKNIWVFVGIYIGVNNCNKNESVFVFRKFDRVKTWLKFISKGMYVIDGYNLNATKRHAFGVRNEGSVLYNILIFMLIIFWLSQIYEFLYTYIYAFK